MSPDPEGASNRLCVDTRIRRRLLATRAVRSLGQGMLVVDFPLYLAALGWSGVQIGVLFATVISAHAAMTLVSGPLSDRFGRRRFLLFYESVLIASAALALCSNSGWAVTLAAIGGGFGRGINGAAGPFSPVEQAWLAGVSPRSRRSTVFSLNTALGSLGMALGALLAALPAVWASMFTGAEAYRPLFALVLCAAAITLLLLLTMPRTRAAGRFPAQPAAQAERPRENQALMAITLINAVNGVAVGLIGPLITYWFHLRYGVGPGHIGPVLALAFAATAGSALLAGRLSRHGKLVSTVVRFRVLGIALLLAFPLMPTFSSASAIYILRAALNRGTIGARQALNLSLISDRRRGLAATLSALSTQIPRAVGPVIAGAAFSAGALIVPFYVASALQVIHIVAYRHVFGRYERWLFRASNTAEPADK